MEQTKLLFEYKSVIVPSVGLSEEIDPDFVSDEIEEIKSLLIKGWILLYDNTEVKDGFYILCFKSTKVCPHCGGDCPRR